MNIRVHIDENRCTGHGRCYTLCPQVFEPDEWSRGKVKEGVDPGQFAEAVKNAAGNCPEQAIKVES